MDVVSHESLSMHASDNKKCGIALAISCRLIAIVSDVRNFIVSDDHAKGEK